MDLARVLINSNVFYWYWRSFGDAFHLNVQIVGDFPIPLTKDTGYKALAERLDSVLPECTSFKKNSGIMVQSYNLNRRMDILLEIDDWIVQQVAPNLGLARDIFAQYKSNSFLRPLDLSVLAAADDEESEE